MSIENITNKILEEAKMRETEILEVAEKEASNIEECTEIEIVNLVAENKKKAKLEGELSRDRKIQSAKLQARNQILEAKQSIIDKVFLQAIDRLSNMSIEEFKHFFDSRITEVPYANGGVIYVNSNWHGEMGAHLKSLKIKELTLAACDDTMGDGYIIRVGDICYNYTFKSVVESIRADITTEIVKELF